MKKLLYKRRGILALLALVAVVTAALGGAIPYFYRDLPEPAKANRDELLRWLIVKDLAEEPPATQLALAERLEVEFGSGVDWSEFEGEMDEAQCGRLMKNIPAVLRPWILKKADAYGRLPTDRRAAFLDRLIDKLEVWQGVEKLLPQPSANASEPSPKLAAILTREMERLQKEAPAAQRKQLARLWADLQVRWFLRSIAPKT
jgi:hypothetical protein